MSARICVELAGRPVELICRDAQWEPATPEAIAPPLLLALLEGLVPKWAVGNDDSDTSAAARAVAYFNRHGIPARLMSLEAAS